MTDTSAARCPECGEPLLAYESDAGGYVGCPECLWADQQQFPVADPQASDAFLDSLPSDPLPGWLIADIDQPPTESEG